MKLLRTRCASRLQKTLSAFDVLSPYVNVYRLTLVVLLMYVPGRACGFSRRSVRCWTWRRCCSRHRRCVSGLESISVRWFPKHCEAFFVVAGRPQDAVQRVLARQLWSTVFCAQASLLLDEKSRTRVSCSSQVLQGGHNVAAVTASQRESTASARRLQYRSTVVAMSSDHIWSQATQVPGKTS